jgi:glutaminase
MLKAGTVSCDPEEAAMGYVRQCSINVHVRDLAMMTATVCTAELHPITGDHIIPQTSSHQALLAVTACGMCNSAKD